MAESRLARLVAPSLLAALAACSESSAPNLPVCKGAFAQAETLAVGQYALFNVAADSGCVQFPDNSAGPDTVIYLVAAQSATGTPGVTSSFSLHGLGLLP